LDCRIDDPYNPRYPGETAGQENSRCINAYYQDSDGSQVFQPACMEIRCAPELNAVLVGQSDALQVCSYDGELLPVPNMADAFFVCPRLAAVCPSVKACPDDCFGRGECERVVTESGRVIPTCRCFDETNTDVSCKPQVFWSETVAPTDSPLEATLTAVPVGGQPVSEPSNSTPQPVASKPTMSPATSSASRHGIVVSFVLLVGLLCVSWLGNIS